MSLTIKQEKFITLYHKNGNATQSYIDAGYKASSRKSAEAQSSRLLSKDKVKQRLAELKSEAAKAHIASVKDLIELNARIAFSHLSNVLEVNSDGSVRLKENADIDILDSVSFSESSNSDGSSRSLSIKRSDRIKAAQEIARLIGAYDKKDTNDRNDEESHIDGILQSINNFKK